MKFLPLFVVLCLSLASFAAADHGASCGVHAAEKGPGLAIHGREVAVSAAARELIGLTTVTARRRPLQGLLKVPGLVELGPESVRACALPVAGRVELAVRAAQEVRAGDLLATVVSPELAVLAETRKVLRARRESFRAAGTRNAEIESQAALKDAEWTAVTQGVEVVDAALGRFTLRARADGFVTALEVASGAQVERGATLLRIADRSRVRVLAYLPASRAAQVRDGMKAVCEGRAGSVVLGTVGPNGLVPVHFAFDPGIATDGLFAGRPADLEIATRGDAEALLAVPDECLVRDGLEMIVFVREKHDGGESAADGDAETFAAVTVVPGLHQGGWVAVTGIEPGAEVVHDGAYELLLSLPDAAGAAKNKAGHFHADGTFAEEGSDNH